MNIRIRTDRVLMKFPRQRKHFATSEGHTFSSGGQLLRWQRAMWVRRAIPEGIVRRPLVATLVGRCRALFGTENRPAAVFSLPSASISHVRLRNTLQAPSPCQTDLLKITWSWCTIDICARSLKRRGSFLPCGPVRDSLSKRDGHLGGRQEAFRTGTAPSWTIEDETFG